MTDAELRIAWAEIRRRVEAAAAEHNDDHGHELCPWNFDATELPDALSYIDTVLEVEDLTKQ